ncbi:MAG: glycosyltransferase family 4 protein [Phycisphaerales bacterium]|nr:glycosyltransferase family 4 protein [Phycisphaerales bacterium]
MNPAVAIVSREYPPHFGGGIGTYARHIVPALAEAGCRVHVITLAYDDTHPRLAAEGPVTVHRLPLREAQTNWTAAAARFSAEAALLLARLHARGEIDVAEFAEFEGAGTMMVAAQRIAGPDRGRLPCVVHLHTPTELIFALRSMGIAHMSPTFAGHLLFERAGLLNADAITAPSRFIADWATEHYGLARQPVVIPYALPLPAPAPRPGRGAGRTLLYVGRIEPRKGVEPLIEAWNAVAPSFPDWTLRLVGADTSTCPRGRSLTEHLLGRCGEKVRGRTVFAGPRPHEELAVEYAAADLCVVPSLWENYPCVCAEAMGHGKAVLASDHGGMSEMFGGSRAGVTFSSGRPDDLAEQLRRLLAESPDQLADRGAEARRRIASQCDPARVARQRIAVYRELATSADPPRSADRARQNLRLWRALERLGGGDENIGIPVLEPEIARWIERAAPPKDGSPAEARA